MNRREFLVGTTALASLVPWPPSLRAAAPLSPSPGPDGRRLAPMLIPLLQDAPVTPPPPGKRAPFGLSTFVLPFDSETGRVRLRLPESEVTDRLRQDLARSLPLELTLRITTALDDRECKRIGVHRGTDQELLGEFDLRYAHALQTFAIPLRSPGDLSGGLELRLREAGSPLWLVAAESAGNQPGTAAHLLVRRPDDPAIEPESALLDHLRDPVCRHGWGWMEGCVLDGLEQLDRVSPRSGYGQALRAHLAWFFTPDGRLRAETPRSEPCDDAIDNIESTLMFAPLAYAAPDHPWLYRVVKYWNAETQGDGSILDDTMLSAEGSYTIAYPMARLARLRADRALAELAFRQLSIRRERLWHDDQFWLRWYPAKDERTFPGWARGLTWHFLGSTRTLLELPETTAHDETVADLQRLSRLALRTQRPDGLWNCFIAEPAGHPDTSGSAGLATALALCAKAGWIESAPALAAARRAWLGLLPFVTPDGRLGGVSQANRGGEALQRSDYRVLSAMGAGLAGQLRAALLRA